jgi:hypothetical protein
MITITGDKHLGFLTPARGGGEYDRGKKGKLQALLFLPHMRLNLMAAV